MATPRGVCESCIAISKGTSLDVIELDAASNNGVDDIREITSGAWHGTPGRWKVYIFDEVHQLSKAASAALLKTLEEPPGHVVFVLATTDPHKVLPTIRSRTQHLEFRLISADTLATLLQDVRGAAELGADDATIEAAVRLGRGSARDALSALDQLLATGSISETQPEFDGLFGALVNEDAVVALRSLAELAREGWDPEQLAESFAGEVRQAFLLQVAPEVADAIDADRERLARWGEQLGLARTVRILETVGRAIREMKSAPEKIVMLEVAMVRLTKPELDHSYESLDERPRCALSAVAPRTVNEPSTPSARGSSTDRRDGSCTLLLHLRASRQHQWRRSIRAHRQRPSLEPSEPVGDACSSRLEARRPVEHSHLTEVRERFSGRVVPRTPRSAQLLLRSARVESLEGLLLTIAVPSEEMRQNTELIAQGLKGALEHEFKMILTLQWTVDPTLEVAPTPARRATPKPAAVEEEYIDREDIEIADRVVVVDSVVSHLITEAFPGAEEIS